MWFSLLADPLASLRAHSTDFSPSRPPGSLTAASRILRTEPRLLGHLRASRCISAVSRRLRADFLKHQAGRGAPGFATRKVGI